MIWTLAATARGHLARAASVAGSSLRSSKLSLALCWSSWDLRRRASRRCVRPTGPAPHQYAAAAGRTHAHRSFSSRARGYTRDTIRLVAPAGAVGGVLIVLVVGVTGSLAALGDTLFPATSIGAALAQDFSATSEWLVRWRWTHPTVAFFASIFLIWLLVRGSRRSNVWDNRGLSALVLILLAAQYLLGVLDVVLLAPVWLQVAHLLGADVLWAALVVLTARVTLEPIEQ